MIKQAIKDIYNKNDLTFDQTLEIFDTIMSGSASDVLISSFLTALSLKGASTDEIAGASTSMRNHSLQFETRKNVLEIVGTGGDHSNSFNISTTSAIVVASTGVPVVKHGNRASSSKCGAFDVLEALGVNINSSMDENKTLFDKTNLAFLFAQTVHPAMKYVAPIRREIGIPTIFNIIGPLTNPARPKFQLLGVYKSELLKPMAEALKKLGVLNAMVVHGRDGLDEISLCEETEALELKDGNISSFVIKPEDYGLTRCKSEDLVGGDADFNAKIVLDILNGEKGAKRDAVVLNSAFAYKLANQNTSINDCFNIINEALDSGKSLSYLKSLS